MNTEDVYDNEPAPVGARARVPLELLIAEAISYAEAEELGVVAWYLQQALDAYGAAGVTGQVAEHTHKQGGVNRP